MSFLQDQGLFLALWRMKLRPKIPQLVRDSVALEHRSLNHGFLFFPFDYYIKGIPVISSWRELPGEEMFSLQIIHTTGVESPNCLHSLANLKLTQAWLPFKANMF